jgi:hypothetical protein
MTVRTRQDKVEIYHPTVHERTAIVDAYHRRAAVAAVDDGDSRAEWRRTVRCRHSIHDLATRSLPVAVDRDGPHPGFLLCLSGHKRRVRS